MPTAGRAGVDRPTAPPLARAYTPRVLVAAADTLARQEREQHLRTWGARVLTARTGFEAIVKASCQMPDLIVLDESLGETELAETARLLMICPVTAQMPVLCLRRGRRIPSRVLTGLRRQTVL